MATITLPASRGSSRRSTKSTEKKEEETADTRRHNYAALCRFLYLGAPIAMRHIFNQVHPPISLVDHLSKANIHKCLRRLKVQGVISPEQWSTLYPTNKRIVSSASFEAGLLYVLLRHVCKLSEPYPEGWEGIPETDDHSLGSELARVHVYLRTLAQMPHELPNRDYKAYWQNIEQLLVNLAGTRMPLNKLKDVHVDSRMSDEQVDAFIASLHDWRAEVDALRDKHQRISDVQARRSAKHELISLSSEFVNSGGEKNKPAPPGRSTSMYSQGRMNSVIEDKPRVEVMKAVEKDIIQKFQKRLMDDIHVEDVVGKLVQQAVLSHEEKNKIQLQMSNARCMRMVLDLIIEKGGRSFDIFCDVIKFKYKGIYNLLTEAKKAPYLVTRPDEGSELSQALRNQYANSLSALAPVPWCTHIQLPISDFFQPLYITDLNGRQVTPADVFTPHSKCANPKRILIEGEAGVGKTTLLKHITEQWAKSLNPNLQEKFKLVVYVDLRTAQSGNLLETVVEQCLPGYYNRTSDELYNVFKMYQKRLLFILDGYENIKTLEDEFLDLLHKAMFRDCSIVMATRSNHVTRALLKQFDTRLLVAGIRTEARESMIGKYAKLTDTSLESLSALIEKLQETDGSLVQMYSANPTLCMCLCLMATHEQSLDFDNKTQMMERVITALQMRFCAENKVKLKGNSRAKEWLKTTMCLFEEIAFENLLDNKLAFDLDLALNKYSNSDLLQYGLLQTVTTHKGMTHTSFTSAIFHDYLAAKFLTRIEDNDFPRYIEALTGDKQLEGLLLFFCGLRKDEYENDALMIIFNTVCSKYGDVPNGISLTDSAGLEEDTESVASSMSRATEIRDQTGHQEEPLIEGRLGDYYLSLKCLSEAEGREDLAKIVAASLPGKLYTKSKDFIQPEGMIGFGYVLRYNSPRIVDLDIRLDLLGYYYSYALTFLAVSIETSGNISSLRLRWTSDNLLALFLAHIFGTNLSITTLKIYDESKRDRDNITATVWSNFWSARRGMRNVELFSFTDCRNPALVSSVIHNTPNNLIEFSLRGSTLDMVGMQELCKKMENAARLRIINLPAIQFRKPDFMHIAKGVKHSRSLLNLDLSKTDLDSGSIVALSEALKFNRSMRGLELRDVALDMEGCKALGLALALNKTIHEVNLTGAQIPAQGLEDMQRMKRENVVLVGVPEARDKGGARQSNQQLNAI